MMPLTTMLDRLATEGRRFRPALLALLALVLGMLAQSRMDDRHDLGSMRQGMLLFGVAAGCLLGAHLVSRSGNATDAPPEEQGLPFWKGAAIRSVSWRWAMTLLALLLLGALAGSLVWGQTPLQGGHLLGWLIAWIIVSAAWLLPFPTGWRGRLIAGLKFRQVELAILLSITLFGGWLRLSDLGQSPFTIGQEEGQLALEAVRVFEGKWQELLTGRAGSHSALAPFLLSLPIHLLGPSIGSVRLVAALFGTLAIPALYLLGRMVAGPRVAGMAALLLATFPMHLHFSRIALTAVWDSFYFTASLAALLWATRQEGAARRGFILVALFAGMGQYGSLTARLLPLLIALFLLYLFYHRPERLQGKLESVGGGVALFLILVAPLFLVMAGSPPTDTPVNQMSILQGGWLEATAEARGESRGLVLWDQFRRALFGFAFFPDNSPTWGAGTPLALPPLSLALFLGLVVSFRRLMTPRMMLVQAWFWGGLLVGGVLVQEPPRSLWVVSITPVVALLAGLGWERMARLLARAWAPGERRGAEWFLLALLGGATVLTGLWSHARDLDQNRFGGTDAFIATRVGYDLAARPLDTTLVMVSAPRFYSNIAPLAFLAPDHRRIDLAGPPAELAGEGALLFVVLPERGEEMNAIMETYPQGKLRNVHAPDTHELLYYEIWVER